MNIVSINGRTFIDGQEYIKVDSDKNNVQVIINDNVVGEYTGKIDIKIDGNVNSVNGTCFTINGNVSGNVDGTNIHCGNVGGDVDGTNVTCGSVRGSVDAVNVVGGR